MNGIDLLTTHDFLPALRRRQRGCVRERGGGMVRVGRRDAERRAAGAVPLMALARCGAVRVRTRLTPFDTSEL